MREKRRGKEETDGAVYGGGQTLLEAGTGGGGGGGVGLVVGFLDE
jgi:hypothetical protein